MVFGKPGSRRIVALAFLLLAAIVVPSAMEPTPAEAEPVLGGQLYSTGGTIQVEVLPATAGLTSQLYLLEPGPEVFIATNREVGKVVELGPFDPGVELVFGIRVRGNEFRTGPAERNPDGIVHAKVDFQEDGVAIVGFEDLYGGGDKDYDDNVFRFTGQVAPEPPPDPEPEPEPTPGAQAPIAVAGPDQSVPEGSTVQLDASGSSDPGALGLVASEETGNLPGGTAITATLSSLDESGVAPVINGSAVIGEGVAVPDTALAYVLDLSGSVDDTGGCGGDQNSDGRSDRILDCEIAAALELNEEVLGSGTVAEIGLVTFSSSGTARDLDPTSASASLIAPDADADGDGVLDLEQTLRTLRAGGNTNFEAAVKTACNLLAGSTAPTKVAAFISDGSANRGGFVTALLPCDPPVTFHGFAIGAGNSCTSGFSGRQLQDIADNSGGTCTNVPDVGSLPAILPGVVASQLLTATLTIDGGDPIDISDQLEPPLPVDGPATADFSVEIPALGSGIHEVCLTVAGSDQGGEDSVTTCSPVTDVEGELSYRWELVNSSGPPIVLSSATAEMPTFLAIDDGTYTFELEALSVTGLTDTDQVTVTVTNVDPEVSADSREAFAGGVTLVTASLTDVGWLDTHAATIDWGDGSGAVPVTVSADGAGWGTVFGSHIYDNAGTYDVLVTVTDDDGGTASDTIDTLTVAEPVAVWANGTEDKKTLDWNGGSGIIEGLAHSNNELRVTGDPKTIIGGTEYVNKLTLDGDHTFDPPPVQVGVSDFPISFDIADYAPGGPVATQVGSSYFDETASCSSGEWHLNQEILADGVYYAPCDVHLNGSNIGGRVTLVATGAIQVDGSRPAFEPYYDGLLFLSGAAGKNAVDIAASNSKFLGVIFAGSGEVSLTGSGNRFYCGILGDMVDISGSGLELRGAACGRPSSTVADPALVPELDLLLETEAETALPGDGVSYDMTVTNSGALLVVPGVVGLENVDDSPATVQSYGYQLEYFSVPDGEWLPLASMSAVADGHTPVDPLPTVGGADVAFQQNPFPGVTYPTDGDAIIGTVLDPGGFATWGYQALVALDPATVDMLLDPALVGGVRNRIDFELTPVATQVRRLFRFGTDFVDQLRVLSGDITDVQVTQTLPVGDPAFLDSGDEAALALLAPGDVVTLTDWVTVPTVVDRAEGESDSAYLSRLLAADGDALASSAYARGVGGVGMLVATQVFVVTSEQVPVVAVDKTGPDAVDAGALVEWDIQLNNLGSTAASALEVADVLDGESLELTGVPTALAPAEVASVGVEYLTPADSDGTPLTNRAEATWVDGNGNSYGPLGSVVVTDVSTAADVSATLVDSLLDDADGNGVVSPGDTIHYAASITNSGDQAPTGVTFTAPVDAASSIVAGSVTTSQGTVVSETPDVSVDVGELAGGSTVDIGWDVVIADPFPEGGNTITTQGTIASNDLADVLTDDPAVAGIDDPTTTTVSLPIPVLYATLSGTLAVDADGDGVPSPGDTIRYSSEVANTGGADLTGVQASYGPDSNTTLVVGSVTATSGAVVSGNGAGDTTVQLDLATLAFGATETVTFDVTIDVAFPSGVDAVVVQGIVTSNELQPVPTDDPTSSAEADPTSIPVYVTGGGGGDLPGPVIGSFSLSEGDKIAVPTELSASFTPPEGETVVSWRVTYQRVGTDQIGVIATSDGVGGLPGVFPAGPLNVGLLLQVVGDEPVPIGTFDPTTLPGGTYEITVESEASGGGVSSESVNVVVDDGFKPGRWGASYQDLTLPFPGLPIQVMRSYDSYDKSTGDFGVGWTLDYGRVQVSTTSNLWEGWFTETTSCGLIWCNFDIKPSGQKNIYVTWPDGKVDVFRIESTGGNTFFPGLTSLKLVSSPGNRASGQLLDANAFYSNGTMLGGTFGSGGLLDIDDIVVTVPGGTSYQLSDINGLVSATSPSGEVLLFSDDGITSSTAGPQVQFVWDAQGRITEVIGPDGEAITYEYDANGDLVRVTDALGNVTQFVYDSDHNLVEIIDPLGRPFRTVEYDDDGRVVAVTDALGNRSVIDSDVAGRQQIVTDPGGTFTTVLTFDDDGNVIRVDELFDGDTLTTTFTYNDDNLMTSRTDAQGNTWTTDYNDLGDPVRFVDPLGAATVIDYNDQRLPVTVTDPEGNPMSFEYDSQGNPTLITDAFGNSETLGYDGQGRRISKVDREGNTVGWTYDGDGRMASVTDGTGSTSHVTYTDTGNVVSITDPLGNVSSFTYDASGAMRTMTDPGGNVTTWTYDAGNRLDTETDALGNTTTFGYDDADRLLTVTDPLGHTFGYTYDVNGRVATMVDPTGAVTTYGRDGAGRLTSVTNAAGETTTFALDEVGRTVAVTDPLGNTSTSDYDPMGRLLSSTTPSGATWSYGYDLRGLRTSATDPLGNSTVWAYDALGQLASVTDQRGSETSYDYDRNGQLTAVTDALGGTVSFGYDAAGELTQVTDPVGLVRSFGYDAAGNLLTASNPATGTTSYVYDELGQVTTATDARGVSVGFDYDPLGRVTQITTPDGPVLYNYDAAGRRTSMADPTGTTTWGYDQASRITEVAAPQGTVSYTYDEAGRRESMTQPEGVVSYGYDAAGRLSTLSDWLGNTTTLGYTVDGTLESIDRSNGVSTSFSYDDALRVDEITHTGPAGLIDSFGYTLDEAGNRTSVISSAGSEAYTLDELGRLTQVTYPDGQTVAYSYDAAGNRLSETVDGTTTDYTYDAEGRLTSDGVNSYSYDAAGNTTAVGLDSYSWDWANRLTAATVAGESVGYGYDGDGTRISATDTGGTTGYVWDRASLLPMLVSDGTSGYVHLGRQPNETVTGTDVSFDLTDALGSVRATTDAAGAVTGTAAYDVYGGLRDSTGTLGTFGFAGEQSDPTGLLYLRARYYNPQIGRFLSADALQPNAFGTQGWSQYGYVAGNPTTSVDPTGHGDLVEYSLHNALTFAAVSAGFGFGISIFTCSSDGTFGEYTGCVFRGTLAAAVGGFLFGGANGPLWFMLGSAGVSGFAASSVYQLLGGEFSLREALITGAFSVLTYGLARGAGRLFRYFRNLFRGATNEAELARLGSRVQDFHDVLDPIAQRGRTTAVMGTSGGDVIAGGVRDLSPAQRALAGLDDILGHLPGEHAEVTALKAAAEAGVDPRAIVTSWDICPACARVLEDLGATLTSGRSAVWGSG